VLTDEESTPETRREPDHQHAGAKAAAAGGRRGFLEEQIASARRSIGAAHRLPIV